MWPIVLRTYNLPPWLCKKAPYIMLGPLVDELKELWDNELILKDSVSGYNFKLHTVLMWTVNDFPVHDD